MLLGAVPDDAGAKLRRRKLNWVEESLFPRHVFVDAKAEYARALVRSAVGVTSLAKLDGTFANVPKTLVEISRSDAEELDIRRLRIIKKRRCGSSPAPTRPSRQYSRWLMGRSGRRCCLILSSGRPGGGGFRGS